MFCVIYSFESKPGKEQEFIDAWEGLTKLIYQYEGSLGSRLHQESDGKYIAYAQWPSKEGWENSGDKLPKEAEQFSKQMKEACLKIETIFQLEMVNDKLESKAYKA